MARLLALCVVLFSVSCLAQNGFDQRQRFFQRPAKQQQQSPRYIHPFLRYLKVNPDDHKCSSIVRRPYYMTKWFQVPCQRLEKNAPVMRSFMSPMGPMCVTYKREQVVRYYRIHMCCPGFKADNQGRCTIRTNAKKTNTKPALKPNFDMMPFVAKMRQQMWARAKQEMERRKSEMIMRMAQPMRQMAAQRPRVPQMPHMPMMKHMMNMYNMNGARRTPKIAYLSFKRLPNGAMAPTRVIQRPPFNRGFITLIKRKVFRPSPLLMNQMQAMAPQRPVPRLVMSGRHQPLPFNPMGEFHPPMPDPQPRIDRFQPPEMQLSKGHHDISEPAPDMHDFHPEEMPSNEFQQARSGFFNVNGGPDMNQFNEVNLPETPVEMPQLIVEETPKPTAASLNCIAALESAVKTCLKYNNIEVPDVMTAFEPFNEDMSRYLCEYEEAIFSCINGKMNECNDSSDAVVARGMLQETSETVRSMCELRAISVLDQTSGTAQTQNELTVQGADTVATVENVDAIPAREPTAVDATPERVPETAAPVEPTMAPSKNIGAPEVHVQEIKMKEFLLPVLLGAGLGFMILVLFVSLLLCCCCRRRVAKKMTLAKEPEKPPMKDEIYTIGISPPMYETQGIPPIYYEEAKGEKITSRPSPETAEVEAAGESA